MNLGKTIFELRKKQNITQEELAAELGVTAAAVSKWENNYTLPDILMLCALADHFGVTTDALLGRCIERKYAIIAAESPELAQQIENLAKQNGLTAAAICSSFREALDARKIHSEAKYLLVSCGKPLTEEEMNTAPDDLYILDSPNETADRVLKGFEMFFRGLGL